MKICKTCGLPAMEHIISGCEGEDFDEFEFKLESREGDFTQTEIANFKKNRKVTIADNDLLKKK